jgi:acyl-CoA thioesterase I
MRRELVLSLVAGSFALAIPLLALVITPNANPCIVPAELARLDLPLTRTARRLADGTPITIVAIGSSSTAGVGASSPAATYPSRLGVELAQHFPYQPITVLNHGISGALADDMVARFDRNISAEHPDLVLWQLGTNAVLRDYPLLPENSLLSQGLELIKAIGADVVVIDPQFAPKVLVRPELEAILDLISTATKRAGVDLFHRFALMRHWHEIEGMPFEAFVSPDGLHMNDWSYSCFAKALAAAIADAATRSVSGPPSAHAVPRHGREHRC